MLSMANLCSLILWLAGWLAGSEGQHLHGTAGVPMLSIADLHFLLLGPASPIPSTAAEMKWF